MNPVLSGQHEEALYTFNTGQLNQEAEPRIAFIQKSNGLMATYKMNYIIEKEMESAAVLITGVAN